MMKVPYLVIQIDNYSKRISNIVYDLRTLSTRYPDHLVGDSKRGAVTYSLQQITTAKPKYRFAFVNLYKDEDFEPYSKLEINL